MHRGPLLPSTGDAQTYNARCADARIIGAVETEGEVGIGLGREDTFVGDVIDEQSGLPAVLLPADLRIEQQIGILLRDVFRVQRRIADSVRLTAQEEPAPGAPTRRNGRVELRHQLYPVSGEILYQIGRAHV